MTRSRMALGVICVAALAICVGPLFADDSAPPNPLKALKKATRNLVLEARQGYRAGCDVAGGLSTKADHSLTSTTVRETYRGDIHGDIMSVPDMKVFRTDEKGAVFDGVRWYALQALPEGKKLDRLFAFPAHLLTTALRSPESIEWLPSTEEADVVEAEEGLGRTSVVKKLTQEQLYHRLRVKVPDKEALQYFVEVQNSGCLSGG